jgi:hypothetical protein
MKLVPVGDDATTAAARRLIGEYLSWVAGEAAEQHGLVFDTEAMLSSDIGDRGKFYAPHGRFYLLRDEQAFVGVGALQRIDDRSAGFVEVPPHDGNRMRQYQDEAALDAYRDSAVFMALHLR